MEGNNYTYWVEMAEYDYQTAIAMLEKKTYLYVGFMLHQTIEKIFKAYYVFLKSGTPPYTHNLLKLSLDGGFYEEIPEKLRKTMDILEPLNIEARYPSHKERLMKELNEEFCIKLIKDTEVLYKWVIERIWKEELEDS